LGEKKPRPGFSGCPDGTNRWGLTGATSAMRPTTATFCLDGLVWPDRRPKAGALGAPSAGRAGPRGRRPRRGGRRFGRAGRTASSSPISAGCAPPGSLTADGETIRRGELGLPDVGPGERAQIRLAGWTPPLPDGRVLSLIVRFWAATELAWAPQGSRSAGLSFRSLRDPGAVAQSARPLAALPDGVRRSRRRTVLLVHEMLAAPPRLCLWRAPTDNDRIVGLAAQWLDWGVDRLARGAVNVRRGGWLRRRDRGERTAAGIRRRPRTTVPSGNRGRRARRGDRPDPGGAGRSRSRRDRAGDRSRTRAGRMVRSRPGRDLPR